MPTSLEPSFLEGEIMDWFRWHHGTVTDPKWRVVSLKSGVPVHAVIAIWAVFLERASSVTPCNAMKRGQIDGWDAEDISVLLGLTQEQVIAVHTAMQGKVLEGDKVSGWEARQLKREREDDSSQRVREFRERKRNDNETSVTPCNAMKRPEEIREDKRREEDIRKNIKKEGELEIFGDGLDAEPDEGITQNGFDEWWKIYPSGRKGSKMECRKKYERVLNAREATKEQLLAGAQRYRDAGYDGSKFAASPVVWLNQRRWEAEDVPPPSDKCTDSRNVKTTKVDPRFLDEDARHLYEREHEVIL